MFSILRLSWKWVGPAGEAQGIDPAREMIKVARQNAARAGLSAKFEVGLVKAIPFPDGTFDVVLSRLVMHHLHGDVKQRGLSYGANYYLQVRATNAGGTTYANGGNTTWWPFTVQ